MFPDEIHLMGRLHMFSLRLLKDDLFFFFTRLWIVLLVLIHQMILGFTLVAVLTFESSSTQTAKSLFGKTALTSGVVLAMVFNACALKPKRRNMYHHDENKSVGN